MSRASNRTVFAGSAIAVLVGAVLAVGGPLSPPPGPVASTNPSLADLENSIASVASASAGPADTSSTPGSALDGRPLGLAGELPIFIELDVGGFVTGFWHVSDLGQTIEVVEYRSGGEPLNVIPVPGNLQLPGLTLVRPLSEDTSAADWFRMVVQGDAVSATQNGTLTIFNIDGTPLATFELLGAWPYAYDVRCDGAACSEQLAVAMENLGRMQ